MKRATQLLTLARCQMWISIHALVKRATLDRLKREVAYEISIHALVKRATKLGQRQHHLLTFQSTPS